MMMARGRGDAIGGGGVLALALLVGLLVATNAPPVAEAAASYMVGDYGGWKFNVDRWAKGRTFRAGDVLGTYTYIYRQTVVPPRVYSLPVPLPYACGVP